MKQLIKLTVIGLSGIALAACGNTANSETIRVATSPGPYSELFFDEVAPILEEDGYTVENIEFTDLRAADVALQEGSADLNVDQHSLYMENFEAESGADFTALTPIPTVPTALFPGTKTTLEEVGEGDRIGIPDDPSNYTRAMLVLEKAGWVTLAEDADPANITVDDIVDNVHGIEIIPMQSASIPRSLSDLEYAIIPGSIAYDSGVDFQSQILVEDVLPELYLQAVVPADKAESEWAQAVTAAYQSEELKTATESLNTQEGEAYWLWPEE